MTTKTRRREGSGWIQRWRRLAIYMRDNFCCQYCGKDLKNEKPENVTLDHLRCYCKGGSNHETNLVTACKACNSSRSDKVWTRFATGGAIIRIKNVRRRKLNAAFAKELCGANVGKTAVHIGREIC